MLAYVDYHGSILPALCVTADDFGLSSGINAACLELAVRGRISAVSVMVHGDAVLDGVEQLRDSNVATGLHLVFTELAPYGRVDERLLDDAGRLPPSPTALLARLARHPGTLATLRAEAAAQLGRFRGLGLSLDFLNGHQHAHLLPPLWPMVVELMERERIGAVRAVLEWPRSWRGKALWIATRTCLALRTVERARILSALVPAGPSFDVLMQRKHARDVSPCLELVTHPGSPGERLPGSEAWGAERRTAESAALAAPDLGDFRMLTGHAVRAALRLR